MSYVDSNLMRDERVVYKANIHWFIFVPSAVFFCIGVLLFGGDVDSGAPVYGVFAILIAIFSMISAIITKLTTELAVTSKRVIAKSGLIRRSTVELNHSKVESFNVDQSIFGRIFGFGTLVVNGTGGGKTRIPSIDDPLQFRRNAMETIDASQTVQVQSAVNNIHGALYRDLPKPYSSGESLKCANPSCGRLLIPNNSICPHCGTQHQLA